MNSDAHLLTVDFCTDGEERGCLISLQRKAYCKPRLERPRQMEVLGICGCQGRVFEPRPMFPHLHLMTSVRSHPFLEKVSHLKNSQHTFFIKLVRVGTCERGKRSNKEKVGGYLNGVCRRQLYLSCLRVVRAGIYWFKF